MKTTTKKTAAILIALSGGLASLGGCKSTATIPINFVAVTSSTWNADVSLGGVSYKFQGKFASGSQFVLKGIAQTQPGGGGQQQTTDEGGGAKTDEGGGQQQQTTDEGGGAKTDETTTEEGGGEGSKSDGGEGSKAARIVKADEASQDFTITGTYALKEYGEYEIQMNDDAKTKIYVDYNKTEGRHEFYYTVAHGGSSSFVHFQAKDAPFAKTLPSDYKIRDERDSEYIFRAKATGNNSSVATAYLYLLNDGSVTKNNPNGAQREISYGATWTKNGDVITLKDGASEFTADPSLNPNHPGFRLVYDSKTYYYSANPDVRWKKLTPSDFDGVTKYKFEGTLDSDKYELNLTEEGKGFLYKGEDQKERGTWGTDGDNLVFHTESETGDLYSDFDLELQCRYFVYEFEESSKGKSPEVKTVYLYEVASN